MRAWDQLAEGKWRLEKDLKREKKKARFVDTVS